jgi:uncharacterized protein with NRDE domain
MCTLTLGWRVFEDAPVAVAANRDERLGRPAEPPAVVDADPAFLAPRDAEAGGTWIGYNEHGVFAAITNRWVDVPGGGERSRGLLVRDVLGAASTHEARATVDDAVASATYDGFNLVVAERGGPSTPGDPTALYFEWDGDLHVRRLDPGVHVVVNVGIDGEYFRPERDPDRGAEQAAAATRLRDALKPDPDEAAATWQARAAEALGDHDYGVCVHEPDRGFGTRSSSLFTLRADGTADVRFADGPPCETAFRRVEGQL